MRLALGLCLSTKELLRPLLWRLAHHTARLICPSMKMSPAQLPVLCALRRPRVTVCAGALRVRPPCWSRSPLTSQSKTSRCGQATGHCGAASAWQPSPQVGAVAASRARICNLVPAVGAGHSSSGAQTQDRRSSGGQHNHHAARCTRNQQRTSPDCSCTAHPPDTDVAALPAGPVAAYPEAAEAGGLSGPPLMELSTQVLADMYRLTKGVHAMGAAGEATPLHRQAAAAACVVPACRPTHH